MREGKVYPGNHMQRQIVQKSENFIQQLFKEKLSDDYWFHDLAHTESVREFAVQIGEEQELPEDELEILAIAAWFHDAGYTMLYTGHETASNQIAKSFLEKENYPEEKIELILECIDATRTINEPNTHLQKILKDADLSNLGMSTCYPLSIKLRHEWDVICGNQYTDIEWLENNLEFLGKHQFYTKEAQRMWNEGKKRNVKLMRDLLKIAKEKEEKDQNRSKIK